MTEFKISGAVDRERFIIALANNGYAVKVEERRNPTWSYKTDYYVQILDEPKKDNNINPEIKITLNKSESEKIIEAIKPYLSKCMINHLLN